MSKRGSKAISKAKIDFYTKLYKDFPFPKEGYKKCSLCKETKFFSTEDSMKSEFHTRPANAKKSVEAGVKEADYKTTDSWCKVCKTAKNREYRAAAKARDPVAYKEYEDARRLRYRKRLGEKEWLRRKREQSAMERRRKGIPAGTPRVVDYIPPTMVSVEPLLNWVWDRWPEGGAYREIEDATDATHARYFTKITNGHITEVDIDWVDEILTAAKGPHVSTLYPEAYDQ